MRLFTNQKGGRWWCQSWFVLCAPHLGQRFPLRWTRCFTSRGSWWRWRMEVGQLRRNTALFWTGSIQFHRDLVTFCWICPWLGLGWTSWPCPRYSLPPPRRHSRSVPPSLDGWGCPRRPAPSQPLPPLPSPLSSWCRTTWANEGMKTWVKIFL